MILNSKIYGQEIHETPLLVFHGLFGISDNWGTFGREFGQWMPCHLVDLRNHGKSFHSDEMSHQIMAEDILNYINPEVAFYTPLANHQKSVPRFY